MITRGNLYQQWTYSSSRRQRRRTVCVTVTETSQAVEEEDISWVHVLISQVLKENGDDFKKMKSWSSKLISLYSRWWMKRHCYCEYGRSRLEASRLVKTKARAVEQWGFVRVLRLCFRWGGWHNAKSLVSDWERKEAEIFQLRFTQSEWIKQVKAWFDLCYFVNGHDHWMVDNKIWVHTHLFKIFSNNISDWSFLL